MFKRKKSNLAELSESLLEEKKENSLPARAQEFLTDRTCGLLLAPPVVASVSFFGTTVTRIAVLLSKEKKDVPLPQNSHTVASFGKSSDPT